MVDKIEMSLDDIIKSNRSEKSKTGGRISSARGGRAAGPQRKASIRRPGGNNVSPRKTSGVAGVNRSRGAVQKPKYARGDVNSAWKHDMYEGPKRANAQKQPNDLAKLIVSNLEYGVSDLDIQELFAEFGPLKKAAVHYDRSGRSLGSADVVFERRADAVKAIKQYNGVPLDGRPMNIQLATSDVTALTRVGRVGAPAAPIRKRNEGAPVKRGASFQRRGGPARPKPTGNAAGGRKGKGPAPTAEELDAELDAYVNDMKI